MEETFNRIVTAIQLYLPSILLAIAILIVGWIVAIILSGIVRRLLNQTSLDDRLTANLKGDPAAGVERIQVEKWISTAVFWLVMLFTIIVALQALNLTAVYEPLGGFLNEIIAFIPGLLGALALLLVAWLVATLLRTLVVRLLNASGIVRRFSEDAEIRPQERVTVSQTIGNVVYWLVFLLFLPAILASLNLQGILAPVQGLVDEILGVLPNILGAALILVVGWLVARIVRQIVTSLLAGIGIDRLTTRAGVDEAMGGVSLSNLIGTIVYILILIPVVIAALNTLDIPAVSAPAAEMLTNLLNALPAIFGALLLLGISYIVARLVGGFVASVLTSIGFDRLFSWLGLYRRPTTAQVYPAPGTAGETVSAAGPGEVQVGGRTPSQVAGYLVTIAIMLFAVMEAANLLGFEFLATLISGFIVAASRVLVGLIVFGFGLYLANLADRVIRSADVPQSSILATAARWAIIIFSAALALREMGIAESIVNLAFGLLLGAIAVAAALAFGLGGRDIAGRQLERWRQDLQQRSQPTPAIERPSGSSDVTGSQQPLE